MNVQNLNSIANEFLEKEFSLQLEVPIKVNNRLSRALGRLKSYRMRNYPYTSYPHSIELSGKLLDYAPEDEIIDVLKHELVHYALCVLQKPYNDGDHYFESTLQRLGITNTNSKKFSIPAHHYACLGTPSHVSVTARRINTNKYVCGACNCKLMYLGYYSDDSED